MGGRGSGVGTSFPAQVHGPPQGTIHAAPRSYSPAYQTVQRAFGAIGSPGSHWKAWAKDGLFDTAPITRNFAGECGSVVTCIGSYSFELTEHQTWA